MRRLIVVAVLGLALLAADQGARVFAEARLAARAGEAAAGESATAADIDSFPFLGRLIVSGSVGRVRVRVDGPRAGPLRLSTVVVDASGVALDRGLLWSGRVRLEDVEHGSVAVEVDGDALAEAVDVPVTVADGRVGVEVGGATVSAEVGVDEGALVLRAAGLPALRVPVPRTALIPCAVTRLAVVGDRVRLACDVDELPEALRR